MEAAKKLETSEQNQQKSGRLERLLLNKNYKEEQKPFDGTASIHLLDSRIEAENRLEKLFRNLF